MTVKPEERSVVYPAGRAGFRAKCRLYAPMYRQFTLTALQAAMSRQGLPGPPPPRPTIGYDDVVDAWNYYLAHENHGRGVVLFGHSQGSGVLVRLIASQIDGKPGAGAPDLRHPDGRAAGRPGRLLDVGGDFQGRCRCATLGQPTRLRHRLFPRSAKTARRRTTPASAAPARRQRDRHGSGVRQPGQSGWRDGRGEELFRRRAAAWRPGVSVAEGQGHRDAVRRGPWPDHRDLRPHRPASTTWRST